MRPKTNCRKRNVEKNMKASLALLLFSCGGEKWRVVPGVAPAG